MCGGCIQLTLVTRFGRQPEWCAMEVSKLFQRVFYILGAHFSKFSRDFFLRMTGVVECRIIDMSCCTVFRCFYFIRPIDSIAGFHSKYTSISKFLLRFFVPGNNSRQYIESQPISFFSTKCSNIKRARIHPSFRPVFQ
jgi:hypothetical protein